MDEVFDVRFIVAVYGVRLFELVLGNLFFELLENHIDIFLGPVDTHLL